MTAPYFEPCLMEDLCLVIEFCGMDRKQRLEAYVSELVSMIIRGGFQNFINSNNH